MTMGQLGQTITVVNKSGVVVKNSKQLINVFKEAKNAYLEKKAELKASRDADWNEKRARRGIKHLDLQDDVSRASSRRRKHQHHGDREINRRSPPHGQRPRREEDGDSYYGPPSARPPMDRGYTDSFYTNEAPPLNPDTPHSAAVVHRKPLAPRIEQDLAGDEFHRRELLRRHTDGDNLNSVRRSSDPNVDLDLAYGELPPPLPARHFTEEEEMRGKMTKLTRLLQEADCLQHSATATIEHLQKNPDALAAVALTLAEVSNIASKLAPGALMAMKGSFPAAMALLASPQFLIAAGLGVGVTVVMLGGFKIIKRIQEHKQRQLEHDEPMRLQELDPELSRIEMWRRGIADAESQSVGTSVDGEFITPVASRRLVEEGRIRPEDIREPSERDREREPRKSRDKGKDNRSHHKSRRGSRDDEASRAGSARAGSGELHRSGTKRKAVVKGVKMLFHGRSVPESERRLA